MKTSTDFFIIEVNKGNRTLFIHENGIDFTWMKKFALKFESAENAEETIKRDYHISNKCHSGLTKLYTIKNLNDAINH